MFPQVIASRPRRGEPRLAVSSAAAIAGHMLCLVAVIWATLQPKAPARAAASPVLFAWPDQPQGDVTGPVLPPAPVPDEFPGPISVPSHIDFTPIAAKTLVNPTEWLRAAREVDGIPGLPGPLGDSGIALHVDEPPALLVAPLPTYPELLRTAGITGRVVVQAVVDTSGRAEPGSVRVIASPNPGFDAAARASVLGARFRPARTQGRAVRVQVLVPIVFALTR
ncbi:MAG TPA: energy transducer TonB [Gemmatimonadales bacterium]|nr:energy transducer TonB [Gemmatimonadales bacterium]